MGEFMIFTDSGCDIPRATLDQWGVGYCWLTYVFEGEGRQYGNYEMPYREFYDRVRAGQIARTSAVNAETFRAGFQSVLERGLDILYIGISSAISATFGSALIAAEELRPLFPEREIRCVDSLAASAGVGMLVYMAAEKKKAGGTLDECAQLVLDKRLNMCHWFTVEDLVYLKRGGRISAATALVGNMLGFKPVLHMDDAGHLVNMLALDREGGTVFISHGDCADDAKKLAAMLHERCGAKVALTVYVGPVIGAHSGPGTMALFFPGEHR